MSCYKNFIFLMLLLISNTINADQLSTRNDLTFESRIFENDHVDNTHDSGASLFFRSENKYVHDNISLSLRGFARAALEDSSRNIAALEDAWIMYRPTDGWAFKVGIETLTWTATEGFHPADIINSTNLDSNLENPEKLGEPLVSVRKDLGQGNVTLYYFPYVVEPKLTKSSSRLGFLPEGYSYADAVWLDGKQELDGLADQWGVRFEQTIEGADFAFHYIDHYDRQQPIFFEVDAAPDKHVLQPTYLKSRNAGVTYSQVFGPLILKVEHNYKNFYDTEDIVLIKNDIENISAIYPKNHNQSAAGLEYSLYHDSGSETSLYFEGQWVSGLNREERTSAFVFQRDLLFGFRHALNDVMSKEFICTAIIDTERSKEFIFTLSYRQRLSNVISLATGLRLIDAAKDDIGLSDLRLSDHVFLNLSYHF